MTRRANPHLGPGSGRSPSASLTNQPDPSTPMSTKTETTDNPTAELRSLLREAEKALANTASDAGDNFDELRDRLRAALANGHFSLENIRQETVRRAKQADQLVRENPYYTAGIAAGIGALIGILVSQRLSSR
jgi:ElaB/YqjD/DUF883 family membrane-anchored ribosome-binding protein